MLRSILLVPRSWLQNSRGQAFWPACPMSALQSESWDHAELLQHAERVPDIPAFGDLAVGDAMDPHSRNAHLFSGRRNPEQFGSVSASAGPARDHGVAALQRLF